MDFNNFEIKLKKLNEAIILYKFSYDDDLKQRNQELIESMGEVMDDVVTYLKDENMDNLLSLFVEKIIYY